MPLYCVDKSRPPRLAPMVLHNSRPSLGLPIAERSLRDHRTCRSLGDCPSSTLLNWAGEPTGSNELWQRNCNSTLSPTDHWQQNND